jgi:type IX secretion system PorP/SprF family membrane protein
MNNVKQFCLVYAVLLIPFMGHAQDPQYSQFYAAPLYINPAFTGLTAQHRLVFNFRDQWPALPNAFYSTAFSYDRRFDDLNSGIGLIATGELAGYGSLWKVELAPTYAYEAIINEKIMVRAGVKVGYNTIGLSRSELIFNDQLISEDGATSVESNLLTSRRYVDISAGALGMMEFYWFGFAVSHLNTPDQSLLKDGESSILPTKVSFHGGAKIPLSELDKNKPSDEDISPAFQYKSQAKFDQLDLGIYYNRNPMVFGMWYRGIQFLKRYEPGFGNNDAITLMFGIKSPEKFSIGFSYDVTISKLGVLNSAGSGEVSMIYEWAVKKKRRKKSFIVPCAKF